MKGRISLLYARICVHTRRICAKSAAAYLSVNVPCLFSGGTAGGTRAAISATEGSRLDTVFAKTLGASIVVDMRYDAKEAAGPPNKSQGVHMAP